MKLLSSILATDNVYTNGIALWFVLPGQNSDNTIKLVSRKITSKAFSNWPTNSVRVNGENYLVDESKLNVMTNFECFQMLLQPLRKEAYNNPMHITASRLQFLYECWCNDNQRPAHWFERGSMRFFGDTMGNFSVVRETRYDDYHDVNREVYSVYRKSTTRKGAPCGYLASFGLDGECHGKLAAIVEEDA